MNNKIKSPADFAKAFNAIKHIQCPSCHKGTLELLTEKEWQKLQAGIAYPIPDRIYGCDECKFWGDAQFIEKE